MIEQLKQMYARHIITEPSAADPSEDYVWFRSEEGPIGILKAVLSEKEQQLLEMFLTPYFAGQPLDHEQSFWHDLLFSGKAPSLPPDSIKVPFRFIYFYVKDPTIDIESFSEAVDGLFPSELTVLWETEQEGILVEPVEPSPDNTIGYEELVDAVTSDFYTDLILYVGGKQSQLDEAPEQFRREKKDFRVCRKQFPAKSVFYHDEQIPFLLLQLVPEPEKTELFHELLREIEDDQELLRSIYQYLVSDMNVTTAAKKLFIHRNSLQYRVDKFVEKTGLDVKSFPQAVTVYLALLEQHMKK